MADRVFAKGKKSNPDPVRFRLITPDRSLVLPTSLSYEDPRWMPPIFDQGNVGSCVLNGTLTLAEFLNAKRHGSHLPMSRRAAYRRALERFWPNVIADNGLDVSNGLAVLKDDGFVREDRWPYMMDVRSDFFEPVPSVFWQKDFQLLDYVSVPNDVQSMKLALYRHGMIVQGSSWSSRWESEVGSDGMLDAHPDASTDVGGHCTVLVGWSDHRQAFRLRNSWGTDWGDHGYAWLPYAVRDNAGGHFWPTDLYTVDA